MNSVRISSAFFVIFLTCTLLFSQGSAGRILGSVTDPTGAIIPGVTVTIRDVDRGTITTSSGPRHPMSRVRIPCSDPGGHRAIQLGLKIIF